MSVSPRGHAIDGRDDDAALNADILEQVIGQVGQEQRIMPAPPAIA